MSLSKVPIIVILTIGFKAMLTSPNPPPRTEEAVQSTKIDIGGMRYHRHALGHVVQALVAAAEIAAIFAINRPSSPVSQKLLSITVFKGGQPQNLRLTPLGTLGAIFWACGAALRVRTYKDLGSFFRYEISIQKDHRLITTGPYAYVRHPAYSGMLLANIGWFLWNFAEGSWMRESGFLNTTWAKGFLALYTLIAILPTSAVTLSRMSNEDRALKQKFGKEWHEWAARVPYSVIPGIW